MNHLWLGVWIWIGVMPVAGMLVLRLLRREAESGENFNDLDDDECNLIALLAALFWPGVLAFLLLLAIVVFVVVEYEILRYRRAVAAKGRSPRDDSSDAL